MNVMDIIALHQGAADILSAYGLNCFHCAFNTMDSLEAGAKAHGLTDDDITNIVDDLTDLLKKSPARDPVLTLTKDAAFALRDIAKVEGKDHCILEVVSDGQGGFCMEFASTIGSNLEFRYAEIDDVSLSATKETLQRIGGSTVDFREGRFKLDLVAAEICDCGSGRCTCRIANGKWKMENESRSEDG